MACQTMHRSSIRNSPPTVAVDDLNLGGSDVAAMRKWKIHLKKTDVKNRYVRDTTWGSTFKTNWECRKFPLNCRRNQVVIKTISGFLTQKLRVTIISCVVSFAERGEKRGESVCARERF